MKLMTKELETQFKKIGRQEGIDDPIVVAKFFNPSGAGTWFATEMYYVVKKDLPNGEVQVVEVEASKVNGDFGSGKYLSGLGVIVDINFFGYISIHGDFCDEWGYFSLSELQSVKCPPFGLGIERDIWFEPQPISKVCPGAYQLIRK